MCGIVGIINSGNVNNIARKGYFEQALYTDALRGWDSTGVMAINRTKDIWVYKRAMQSADYMGMRPFGALMDKYSSYKCLIGHNRKATKGGIVHANAHPFNIGNITMVHNGTLDFHKSTLPDGDRFIVDSEALTYSVDKIGAVETFERAEGAFACVWYNDEEDTVNLIRNDERPLSYAFTTDGILIASEKLMLIWLADRNNLPILEIVDLVPGQLTTFQGDMKGKPQVKPVKLVEPYYGKWTGTTGKKGGGTTTNKDNKTNISNVIILATDGEKEKQQKKREIIQARRLSHHELKLGETLVIDSVGFVAYDKNSTDFDPTGKVDGLYCYDGDALLVEMHQQKKSTYKENECYRGRLIALRAGDTPADDVLIVAEAVPFTMFTKEELDDLPGIDDDLDCVPFDVNDPDTWSDEDWEYAETTIDTDDDDDEEEEDDSELRFPGPSGRLISKEAFDTLTEDGCQFCGGYINSEFAADVGWIDGGHGGGCVCHECYPTYKHYGVFNGVMSNVH